MATVAESLFGVTPESLQQERQNALLNRGIQLAQLDPFQQAYANIYAGAGNIGRGVGGLLGAEDPELQRIKQRQGMLQGIDLTNADSLKQGIQTAMQNKDYALVSELTGRYQAVLKTALEGRKTESEILKNLREGQTNEMKNAQSYADSLGLERGSQEWAKAYNTKFTDLIAKNPSIDTVGVAMTTREPVYMDRLTNEQFTIKDGKRVAYNGGIDRTTSKTNVSVDAKGETEFVKKLGELDAKRVDAAFTLRDNATSSLNSLNKLAQLPSQDLITGQFATGRVGATNLLVTLGLASKEDANRLATSQQYQKVAGDVILQTLGGKLGSGFSNADRDFIASLVPQLETNPNARRELIKFMQSKNKEIIDETIRLENYARENKGLKGFVPKIPVAVTPSGSNQYSNLSDAELEARIKAAQANQKK